MESPGSIETDDDLELTDFEAFVLAILEQAHVIAIDIRQLDRGDDEQ
jgi:hypothetical protein